MSKLKILLVGTVLKLNCFTLFSQINIDTTLLSINDTIHHFYVIKSDINITSAHFVSNSATTCRLNSGNQFVLFSEGIDSLKQYHQKFSQKINNVPIENSRIILHSDQNLRLMSINGIIENNVGNINTNPTISEQKAIDYAINNSTNKYFLWLDTENENNLKERTDDSLATSYPKAQLVITKIKSTLYNAPGNYILAYKVPINYIDRSSLIYYVNAQDGSVIKVDNPIRSCFDKGNGISENYYDFMNDNKNEPQNSASSSCQADCQGGTADIYYYPSQYIYTERFNYGLVSCTYRLKEVCSGVYIYVTNGSNDFRDNTNLWTTLSDKRGTTTFWSLSWANRFWMQYLYRNSYDDNYHQITAQVGANYSTQFNTSNGVISVGTTGGATSTGAPIGNWTGCLDVMGHELTHGVTDTECQLNNTGESGAIGEGISDIFGTLTEFWTARYKNLGKSPNYEYAEDISSACGKRRSLSNPEDYCGASTYMAGPNWKDPNDLSSSNDFGGVHYNAGVLGKWFYLLSEGGSGTNDLGNQYCVRGIGQDKASWILYQVLRYYMTSNTNFHDLRFYTEYYTWQWEKYSPDFHSVVSAWYAVGLENNPLFAGLPVNINNKTETTNNNYAYNSRIQVFNYSVNPSTQVSISSGDYIQFFSEDPPQTWNAVPKDVLIKSGSEFHAYIAPGCSGGARIGNFNNSTSDLLSNDKQESILSDFNILPNPNSGLFKIIINKDSALPKSITIRDVLGREIINISKPGQYETDINLKEFGDGIYFINVYFSDKTVSKRVIKN